MTSTEIRQKFLDFFKSKGHHIVPSAPMVIKNDPTLMFTNAGMNQFKDIFLGNSPVNHKRIADTQKCLRVSGKHNDLEEVGVDTYHHTMFEMLGNWSFGDYFKKEAIEWAWELLTEVYKIDKERLYVTVFGGDKEEGLARDDEAYNIWKKIIQENRICYGTKKDNFWEMGDTGPCGPCSEIHIDLRDEIERKKVNAVELINKDNPLVIEIWNLVFIEFNRLSDGKLVTLPAKHVDTGMGFERLCMVVQGKKSNYDTDVFQPIIDEIGTIAHIKYGKDDKSDRAMRVIADHLRAIVFAIADGQLPSNNKAGYVIRRILRRAVRYGYTFLNLKEPFIHELVPLLVKEMSPVFPEILKQKDLVKKVIAEEEFAFLRTLSSGIKRFDDYITGIDTRQKTQGARPNIQNASLDTQHLMLDANFVFELYDTYGFPVDLTQLMAKEKGMQVDMGGFEECMQKQKSRSREDAEVKSDDWVILSKEEKETEFVGYESMEADAEIVKYRKINAKNNEYYQIVLNRTPFYAESGGQVGDKGVLLIEKGELKIENEQRIYIEDTKKENNLIIHITKKLPFALTNLYQQTINNELRTPNSELRIKVKAFVDIKKRTLTMNNHSATHLLNGALRQVLGKHVEQRGSLVDEAHFRFDFTHFSKMTKKEIAKVESIVNAKIRENIKLNIQADIPVKKAFENLGATGVFGEKYGEFVRVVTFDKSFSIELCGGTHVPATGQIGLFKITSESAIAAGIRRIEGITAIKAEEYINEQLNTLEEAKNILKNPKDLLKGLKTLVDENSTLQKQLEGLQKQKVDSLKESLIQKAEKFNDINFIAQKVDVYTNSAKYLAFGLNKAIDNLFVILGNESEGKANITIMISEKLIKEKDLNAGKLIRELAKEIDGGGGGQPHFASAGGKNPQGIPNALNKAREIIIEKSKG